MQRRDAQPKQRLPVLAGAIAHVALQAIARETGSEELRDQAVAGLLCQHTGRSDRQTVAIALHQGFLFAGPFTQGEHAVDEHKLRLQRQFLQGTVHGPLRGQADTQTINLGSRGLTQGPGTGLGLNDRNQRRPPAR